mgnify:FL=1
MKKIKLNNGIEMKRMLLCILVCLITTSAFCAEKLPLSMYGVVYDVGLMFGGKNLSVSNFRKEQVVYDMSIIKHVLNCNTVRIEGENLDRLSIATEEAHKQGLKVLFNPWKMEADSATTVDYMIRASKVAEKLRLKGADLIFVTGCEYTLFNRGVFPGDTFDKRIAWLMKLGSMPNPMEEIQGKKLNLILQSMASQVRKNYHGKIVYSSGAWETVDWTNFDYVGVDYYHNNESDEQYIEGLNRYKSIGKPVIVMEMGCCAYQGAAERGGNGFSVFKGVDSNGNGIYEGGKKPVRDESVQADYISKNIDLLQKAGASGIMVYVFSYPIYPYSKTGVDYDMVAYSLVKSFPSIDARNKQIPSWEPKEAFYRVGEIFGKIKSKE